MQPVRSLRHSTRAAQLRTARTCHDHLAGRLGAQLLIAFVDAGWITRTPGQRAVRVTETGRDELRARLGLELPDGRPCAAVPPSRGRAGTDARRHAAAGE